MPSCYLYAISLYLSDSGAQILYLYSVQFNLQKQIYCGNYQMRHGIVDHQNQILSPRTLYWYFFIKPNAIYEKTFYSSALISIIQSVLTGMLYDLYNVEQCFVKPMLFYPFIATRIQYRFCHTFMFSKIINKCVFTYPIFVIRSFVGLILLGIIKESYFKL